MIDRFKETIENFTRKISSFISAISKKITPTTIIVGVIVTIVLAGIIALLATYYEVVSAILVIVLVFIGLKYDPTKKQRELEGIQNKIYDFWLYITSNYSLPFERIISSRDFFSHLSMEKMRSGIIWQLKLRKENFEKEKWDELLTPTIQKYLSEFVHSINCPIHKLVFTSYVDIGKRVIMVFMTFASSGAYERYIANQAENVDQTVDWESDDLDDEDF